MGSKASSVQLFNTSDFESPSMLCIKEKMNKCINYKEIYLIKAL